MNRRLRILLLLLACILVGVAVWAWQDMDTSGQAAAGAWADLAASRSAAGRIRAYRDRPTLATDSERLDSDTIRLIEQAARKAGISTSENLQSVIPDSAGRIGDTVYKEKPTRVNLRKVTLPQVAKLLYELVGGEGGFNARSLRLSAPRQAEGDGTWTVDLVLTYLIYDPPRAAELGERH